MSYAESDIFHFLGLCHCFLRVADISVKSITGTILDVTGTNKIKIIRAIVNSTLKLITSTLFQKLSRGQKNGTSRQKTLVI